MSDAAPSALLDLVQFLRHSQETVGLVKIPIAIEDAVKRDLLPQSTMSINYVEAIVVALDHHEPSLCSRLDLHAFIIVYLILSKAEDCVAQQRGLALLTESLQNFTFPLQDASRASEKKIRLGQKALSFLIQNFGNQRRMRWTRRWMGIFALELLRGCSENKALLLKKAQDSWRSIGDNILHGTCEILKLVAGLLISELWPEGPPTDAPWFSERDSAVFASFPGYINHSSQWIVDFESFVDVLDAEGFLGETRSGVFLAYGISIGSDLAYGWEDQCTILVTISTELNIVVCSSENSPARYIDILYDQIESVSLEKRPRISQSNPLVPQHLDVLVIWLTRSSDKTLYLGAGKRLAPLINIAFTSIDEATEIVKRLLERAPHIVEKFTCSESEPLSLSQPMVGKFEEQGMLYGVAAQVEKTRPAIVTSAIESVSLPTFFPEPEPDLTHSFLNWPKNISTGLLRTTDLSDLRSDTGISIEEIEVNSRVSRSHSPIKNLEDMSEGSLRNSAEWRKGAMLIDTAPELQDTKNHAMEEGELFGKRSPSAKVTFTERGGDDNGFYNASPKGQNTDAERVEQVSTHNEKNQGPKQALEHTLVHRAKIWGGNQDFNAEFGQITVAGVAESVVQAPRNHEHVNKDITKTRKLAVVNKKYTSKKKLSAIDASKTSKQIAVGKNHTDRNGQSLNVKESCLPRDKEGKDEFDFPLSPRKTRTPRTVRRPISKKVLSKEGAISSPPETKASGYRPILRDKDNPLFRKLATQKTNPGNLPSKAPFEPAKAKGPNDESTGIKWVERLVPDEKLNRMDSNPIRKRLPRGKAKSTTKRSRNKDNEAYSSKKGLRENMRKANQKTRSAPRPAPQPRSRRAAALIADQRIKNTINCDTSQEQSRARLTHDVEISSPNPSQEALPPDRLARNNPNVDHGGSQQTKPQYLSNPNHDDMLKITPISRLRPQDGDVEVVTDSHATELAENQKRHSAVVPAKSTLQHVPVSGMIGTPDLDDGTERAREAQLAGFTAVTASPEGDAYVRTEKDKMENDRTILYPNRTTKDGPKSPSVIGLESSHFDSLAPPNLYTPHGARESGSSEGLVSALEISDSQVEIVSGKSRRFVEMGGKRRALEPDEAYQKAEDGTNLRAATAVTTTTPVQRGNNFAINLKKALSTVQISASAEQPRAPEVRVQSKSMVQDKMDLETFLARPFTESSTSQVSAAEGFPIGDPNQILETAKDDPYSVMVDDLQEPSKRAERTCTTISPWESALTFHGMGNSYAYHEENTSSYEHSENEIQVDEGPKAEKTLNIQVRRTPKRPKPVVLQPFHTPHRTRRANSGERLRARAINSWATPTNTSRDVNRKSNLISFNSKGPRNQGVTLNQRNQLASPSQPETSRPSAADVDRSLKRKLPNGAGESSDLETDLVNGKRPRISTRIPKVQDMAQHRSSILTDATYRPSSQSTRVNENGSPMPFVRSRHFVFKDHGGHDSTKIGKFPRSTPDDDQGNLLAPGDGVDTEPDTSAPRTRLSKATKISWRSSSGSSKRKRYLKYLQSPRTDQLTAHRIHPNGEFINVQTETAILPIRPPDPFIEARKPHQNTFMEMLRRSSNLAKNSSQTNRLGLSGQDFDKVLDENVTDSPSTENSYSDSSSDERWWWSSSQRSSDNEEGLHEEESWRDKLEPHQKGQLNALYDISHCLVARLIDKENAIHDLVLANKQGGMRIIHESEKARKEDIQIFQNNTDEFKSKMNAKIREEVVRLKKSSMDRTMKRTPVADLEKDWKDQQRNMWAQMEKVLTAASTNSSS